MIKNIVLLFTITLTVFTMSCMADNSGITYEVRDAKDLIFLSTRINTFNIAIIKFMNDIDMDNQSFDGIAYFNGIMDGQGYKIKNLNIDKPNERYVGLICVLGGGMIKNLTIENGSIKGENHVGAFVGSVNDNSTVIITHVTNGANVGSIVESVNQHNNAGGIIGSTYGDKVTILNVGNSGEITGGGDVGGIVGLSLSDITIKNAVNSGNITLSDDSDDSAGGIIGYNGGTAIIQSVINYGDVGTSGEYSYAGGIIGEATGRTATVLNAKNFGNIKAPKGSAGGIISVSTYDITIQNVINSGSISAFRHAGGIIGGDGHTTTILNAGNTGSVKGYYAGGIVGIVSDITTIQNAYNYSAVTGDDVDAKKGGMVGFMLVLSPNSTTTVTITTSYYLTGTANNAVGDKDNGATLNGTANAISTDQFRDKDTFVNWDFEKIWKMSALYPELR